MAIEYEFRIVSMARSFSRYRSSLVISPSAKGKCRCLGITLFELDRYASLHPDFVVQVHDLINMIQKELPQAGEVGKLPKPQARETLKNIRPKVLLADAGYDSEESHRFPREEHGIRTIIPNRVGRPTKKLSRGKYRKQKH